MAYQIKQAAKIRGTVTGAVGGVLWPETLAKEVFGRPLDAGSVFLYLFRRFGYPIYGWDGYKEICNYTLTTPMRDVYLFVSIKTGVDWGYLMPPKMEQICQQEDVAPFNAWWTRFDAWAKEQGHIVLHKYSEIDDADLSAVATPWLAARGLTEADINDEIKKKFWDEQEAKLKGWREEYYAIDPWPERKHDDVYGETRLKVWEALRQAMEALKAPVRVRDSMISITGNNDLQDYKCHDEHDMAGCGIGALYEIYADSTQRNRWWDAIDRLIKVGDGSMLVGIERLLGT